MKTHWIAFLVLSVLEVSKAAELLKVRPRGRSADDWLASLIRFGIVQQIMPFTL